MNDVPSLLFVCTANICRSPMAMGLFTNEIAKRGDAGRWHVQSAGTWAVDGRPVATKVQFVMDERRIDLRQHRARTVSRAMLQDFDLVLVMAAGHREALALDFPESAGKVHLLSEMAGDRHDIPDPINGTTDEVRVVARELDLLLNCGFERIRHMVGLKHAQMLTSPVAAIRPVAERG